MGEASSGNAYIGAAYAALIIAALLAWPISLQLLRVYKARILRLMSTHSGVEIRNHAEISPGPRKTSDSSGIRFTIDKVTSTSHPAAGKESLLTYAVNGSRRTALIYALAGLAFAAIMAAGNAAADEQIFNYMQWIVLTSIYAWPIVIATNLVLISTSRIKAITAGCYFLILLVIFSIAASNNPEVSTLMLFASWVIFNIPPSLLFLMFLNRRIRAVGPMVFTYTLIAIIGAIFSLSILNQLSASMENVSTQVFIAIADALNLSAGVILILFILFGLLLFSILGWIAIKWITHLYQSKKLNAQSLTIDSLWILFGGLQAVGLAFYNPTWALVFFVGLGAYKAVVRLGFSRVYKNKTHELQSANLLFLRVFSLGKRSEKPFDVITGTWSYIGNVLMISGPDLATSTIEPDEFLKYLSGKIDQDFVVDEKELELKLAGPYCRQDFDNRYRINEFFCYDNSWRMVVERLVQLCDAVFMDVRGFTAENAGATFEINTLLNSVPLSKIILAIDTSTDEKYLEQTVVNAWKNAGSDSPNRTEKEAILQLLHLECATYDDCSQLPAQIISNITSLNSK